MRPAAATAVAAAETAVPGMEELSHGSVVVAAITSCTNTSNPSVMIGAGLLARNAVKRGLKVKPWVKTSLAPGSLVVTEYLKAAGLLEYLAELGFNIVGYGCTTCIGNSGPLPEPVSSIVTRQEPGRGVRSERQPQFRGTNTVAGARQLSGVAAARRSLRASRKNAGRPHERTDRQGSAGEAVYLRDIWPSEREIQETMLGSVKSEMFRANYAQVFKGDDRWRSLPVPTGRAVRLDRRLDLHSQPAIFRRSDARADTAVGHLRRARSGRARR